METFWKSVVTLVIWTFATGIVVTGMISESTSIIPIAIICMIAATISTAFVQADKDHEKKVPSRLVQGADTEKAKRTASDPDAKMRMLMELMDEDERIAFKQALKQQILRDARLNADGELNYDAEIIESYMDEDDRYSRR
jgi:flagellar motor component MotA